MIRASFLLANDNHSEAFHCQIKFNQGPIGDAPSVCLQVTFDLMNKVQNRLNLVLSLFDS